MEDIYEMSDDAFLESYPAQFMESTPKEEEEEKQETITPDSDEEEASEEDEQSESDDVGADDEEEEGSEETNESLQEDGEETEDETEAKEELLDESTINYQEEYEALLKPFKANGSEMSVTNVEEAHKLMSMGANYSKKMTGLKPNLKMMKMLDNNDLLSEDKINLLIDVAKGNPEAISKLVRDNKIDPLDLNVTEENKYTPKNHTVGDHEVELDEVVSRIQDTASFTDTMNIVSSKWDEASKRDIASAPQHLEVINEHVSNGTYAKVIAEVNRIQTFGGLQGLSTFDAYKQVGEQMFQAGKLDIGQPTPKKVVKTTPKAKQSDKPRKDKRKAASPAKNSGSLKVKQDFNPLNMSDEEFEKQFT